MLITGGMIMATPFLVRMVLLSGVSPMAEPFDVDEFARWDIADSDNAFTDYKLATDLKAKVVFSHIPENVETVINEGWSKADGPLIEWMKANRAALEVWRRGTAKQHALYISPRDLSFTSVLPVVQEQRMFARLASLEAIQSIEKGELDEAFQWARAMFRSGGHTTHRGCLIQGLVGCALHSMAANRIQQWASQPELTSAQLLSARAAIRADNSLYESPSNLLKSEYMAVQNTIAIGNWNQAINTSGVSSEFAASAMRAGYWVIGEPELMLRLYRQVIANQIREIDKPLSQRPRLVGTSGIYLFDTGTAELLPGQMSPIDIDHQVSRSPLMKMLAPAMQGADRAFLQQQVRQAALEVLLAAQAWHRDFGQFPMEITDLVPKYLDQIPLDVFDRAGGTLRYRVDESGTAIVWSVGSDGVNGDGDVVSKTTPGDVGYVVKYGK